MKRLWCSGSAWLLGAGLMTGCGPAGDELFEQSGPVAPQVQKPELTPEVNPQDIFTITADDAYEVYVNGVLVGSDTNPDGLIPTVTRPRSARFIGGDVVAVKVTNNTGSGGLLAQFKTQNRLALTTDKLWKCTSVYEPGWQNPAFVDTPWPQATEYGANGVSPWGFISGIDSSAKWIGTANPNAPVFYCRATVQGCGPDEARNKTADSKNAGYPQGAFDGNLATSWTGSEGDWLRVDLGRPTLVGRVSIAWGYDTSRGASADSELQYSFDNTNWHSAATLTRTAQDSGQPQAQPLTRVSARYWRLVAKRWNGGTGYVKDWQLFYPCDLCDRDMAFMRPPTSSGSVQGFPASNAFDGYTDTYWKSNSSTGAYVQTDLGQVMGIEGLRVRWGWDTGASAAVTAYCRVTSDPNAPENPNDPSQNWKYLHRFTRDTLDGSDPLQLARFTRTDCRHVRLVGTQWNGGSGRVRTLEVLGACPPCTSLTTGAYATASSSTSDSAPGMAVDGSFDTRWKSLSSSGSYLKVDLGSCLDFGQAKVSWGSNGCGYAKSVLKGSSNGTDWDTLATFDNYFSGMDHLRQSAFWAPTACYRHLRLEALDWQGCTGGVSELQVCDSVGRPGKPVP
jgi:hypothetical protein